MSELNEQEFTETPLMPDDIKNDAAALYRLLGAVVHRHGTHNITLTAKEREVEYVLRVDEGEDQTLVISSKVTPGWIEEG
jgi:hypothetical protein